MKHLILVIVLAVQVGQMAFGAVEKFVARVDGSSGTLTASSSVPALTLYDDKYYTMATTVPSSWNFYNANVNNTIRFGINPDVIHNTSYPNASITLQINLWKWNTVGGGFSVTTENRTLSLSNPTAGSTDILDEISSCTLKGAYKMEIFITSYSGLPSFNSIFLSAETEVERYYTMSNSAVTGLNHTIFTGNTELVQFAWDQKWGAEYYELEWTHISNATADPLVPKAMNLLNYNYYLNSTRVVVKGNAYSIPKVFDAGYIVYRVRPVGFTGSTFNIRKEGVWTNVNESGVLTTHNSNIIPIVGEFQTEMNWVHQINYDDDGSRFESVSYSDGLGKVHQSIAIDPETKQSIVSNIYYDQVGRAVVGDLPTPTEGIDLTHKENFNRTETDNTIPYSWQYFDNENADVCNPDGIGFATNEGAGKYYSTANNTQTGANQRVPDAEKFPFTRQVYTDDFTGRLKLVSGAGATLRTGAGHETQLFYPDVNQYELDRLFGAEVGKATHYNKMVTIDANGQIYIQISDMAGRVIASYMAGENPDALDMIEGNGEVTQTIPLLPGSEQSITDIIPSATFTSLQFIEADADFDFYYGFTPAEFHNSCMADNICLDCVYNLDFRILDDCGVVVYQKNQPINGDELTNLCNDEDPYSFTQTVPLLVGEYQIVKKLSVNQDAIYRNWCYYLENNSCLDPLSSYFNQEYVLQTFPECTPELEAESRNECEDYKELMLRDLTPGGQYARFNISFPGGYTAIPGSHSIFTNNGLGTGYGYQNPSTPYLDANGNPALVNGTAPESLTMTQFIQNFQPSWANSLLYLHPEYCYYHISCEGTSTLSESYDYDNGLLATYTYAEACAAGYFHPLTSNTVPIQLPMSACNGTSGIDPFFASGGVGASYETAMNNEMNNYQSSGFSMWHMAIYYAYCQGSGSIEDCIMNFRNEKSDCYNDLIWVTFRNLYLETKQGYVYQAIHAGCPSVPSIGVDAGWENYTSIFGNMETLPDMDGDGNPEDGTGLTQAEGQTYLDNQITQSCQGACEAYADQWLVLLGNCDLTGVDQVALHQSLVDLCSSGCSSQHPMGSSTSSSGATIQSVLSSYGIPMTSTCTGLLISEPPPFASYETMSLAVSKPLDPCACDVILTAEYDIAHGINNPSHFNLEQLIALRTGASLEDAHYLLCACEAAYKDSYIPNAVSWPGGATPALAAYGYSIPATLACKPDNCTDCNEVTNLVANLHDQFSSESNFENSPNYPIVLTNYLNLELGFQLSHADYYEFMQKCGATSENPYCYATQEAKDWISVMKLITFRGTLTSTTPVNLLTQNIVYATGDLKDFLPGNNYWSEVAGNTLTTYWGNYGGGHCNITLNLPPDATFDFEDIASFESIAPLSEGCGNPGDFKVIVSYLSCGLLKTAELTGNGDCFQMIDCICSPEGLTLCDQPFDNSTLCYQPRLNEIYQNAWNSYQEAVQALYESYVKDYNAACASAFNTEELRYTGPSNSYHYTLFYYDQAGNLIKTIAPKGIPAVFDQTNVNAARNSVQSSTVFTAITTYNPISPFPANTYQTTYKYNSYNQLVSTTNPDHDAATSFWYDRLGRLAASQNPVQAADKKYSYVLFDTYGRPVETGQADRDYIQFYDQNGTPFYATRALLDEATLKKDDLGAAFKAYIYSCTRTEVTYTVYDKQVIAAVPAKFAAGTQQNLRLRVASVVYFDAVTASTMPTSGYISAIHYSYDIHGNVIESLQDVPAMSPVQQDIKSTQYQFELLSGNVKKVEFQKTKRDNMTHEYCYDKLNRLTEVFTSTDYGVHTNRDAHYRYFDYGPLARVEIGQHKVQGNDYSYTINGWIKSMNGTTIDINRDAGKDGKMGYLPGNQQVNALFAQDVTGYTLGYFANDYSSIMPTSFLASVGISNPFSNASKNLYNGNIAHTTTAIAGFENQASVYTYDQLQRLKSMSVYRSLVNLKTSNNWGDALYSPEYASSYTYDKNGNIMTLVRKGTTALGLGMDNLTYDYNPGRNQLKKVADSEGATLAYTDDINDLAASTHYTYDQIGQLTYNAESNQTYFWRKGDKKLAIQKSATDQMEFIYNPFGQRICKIQKKIVSGVVQAQTAGTPWVYTYYAYDANGQVMATYKVVMNSSNSVNTAEVNEQMIYGAGRIGLINQDQLIYTNQETLPDPGLFYKNKLGKKNYELSNYLGNVNAVITDRKVVHANAIATVFNSNTVDGWTAGANAGTPVANYGTLNVTTTVGSNNFVQRSFATVSGTVYQLFIRANKGTAVALKVTAGSGVGITNQQLVSGQMNILTFTANAASTNIVIQPTTTVASTFNVDEVVLSSASLYEAVAIMKSDYYPFGMQMPGRNSNISTYRFGYNGMEMDNETKGNGNSYTTEFRQYDPRLGRWLSLDPLMMQFPWLSPYVGMDNNPVLLNDPCGLAPDGGNKKHRVHKNAEKSANEFNKKVNGTIHKYSDGSRTVSYLENGEHKNKYFKQKETPKVLLLGGGDLGNTGELGGNDKIGNAIEAYIKENDGPVIKGDLHVVNSAMFVNNDAHEEIVSPIADIVEDMSKRGGPVILYGYSFGGHILSWVLEELNRRGIQVDVLITIDQASGPGTVLEDRSVPDNVKLTINIFQEHPSIVLSHGGASFGINRVVNVDLSNTKNSKGEKINHGNIDDYTELFVTYHIYQYFKGHGNLNRLKSKEIKNQLRKFDKIQHP